METMDANLTELAKGFGIDKAVVITTAVVLLSRPSPIKNPRGSLRL